jgi:dienelactone hydrolase
MIPPQEYIENSREGGQNRGGLLSRPLAVFIPVLVALLFLGALAWAKEHDPFVRKWFTLTISNHESFQCVAVLPKPMRRYPVVIYAHEAGGDLLYDGAALRRMAELGLATISLEYDQANETAFATQFEALFRYLDQQKWANTSAVAWVGFNLGADRMLGFILQHPERQPKLLILLSAAGLPEGQINSHLKSLHCPVLLVHGERNELFSLADIKRLASVLQTNGTPVEQKVVSGASYEMATERGVVFRCIGEYCWSHLAGKDAWQNYRSLAQRQAEASPLWLFFVPAAAWAGGALLWSPRRKDASPGKIKLGRSEIALRWLAVLLVAWALAETAIHLVTPHLPVGSATLSIARRYLVQPKERADFEYLTAQSIWDGQQLKTILEHVELANYNRNSVNWQVDDKMYQDFVLSPVITGNDGEQLNWRRSLWEEFYPLIRHEASLEDAASVVVRHLRERVTISTGPDLPREVSTIRLMQVADEVGFEVIYVAVLRSVGVPARLDVGGHATFWSDDKWKTAPQPAIIRL